MTNERLTDEQITAAVDAMRMPQTYKDTLKASAIAGDAAARFTVFGAATRTNADRRAAVAAWAARSAK